MLSEGRFASQLRLPVRWYLGFVGFSLPFLFGCQLMATEGPNMPTDLLVWMLLGFTPSGPSFLAPLFSGIGLLLTVCCYPRLRLGGSGLGWVLCWFAPVVAGLVSLGATSEVDYALNWLLHFWGAATYGLSVWWASRHDSDLLRTWCGCVGCGTLLLCAYGFYQRFGGLQAQLAEMRAQHLAEYGQPLPHRIEQKLMQLRVNSFFSDPNVFAAHLLATLPVLGLWLLGQDRATSRRRLPVLCVASLLGLLLFYFTGSRGGMIGLVVGGCMGLWTLSWLQARRWKWVLPALALLFALSVWWYASASLDSDQVSTASVRFEYYRVALEMFKESPWTGKGLGEFFPYFVRHKSFEAEMTRDPHSFFLGCLSQCGVLGGVAVLLVLCCPVVIVLRRTRWRSGSSASSSSWGLREVLPLAGLAGWCIHSFFQFNELIPGTVYLLPVLPLLILDGEAKKGEQGERELAWPSVLAVGAALVCLVWSGLKIPAEAEFQNLTDDLHFNRRELMELGRRAEPEAVKMPQVLRLMQREDTLLSALRGLCERMPVAPGPCKAYLDQVQERVLRPGFSASDDELLRGGVQVAERYVQRVPHRSSAYNALGWMHLALGNKAAATEALSKAREWYPSEGRAYVLEAVPGGDVASLKLVEGVRAHVVLNGQGQTCVVVSGFPPENRLALWQLFAGSHTPFIYELGEDGAAD